MQKSPPLTLRRNFSWTLAGNLVYAACQWGMLVVLAKLGQPEAVGQFTLGLAITSPIVLFSSLQLRQLQVTDVNRQYTFHDYLIVRIFTSVLALAAIVLMASFGNYDGETNQVIILIGMMKLVESISDIFQGVFQQHDRMDWVSQSIILRGIVSVLSLWLGFYFTNSIAWASFILMVSWVTIFIGFDISVYQIISSNVKSISLTRSIVQIRQSPEYRRSIVKLIKTALPMGVVMMLLSLQTNIPRYYVEQYLGSRELGIFAAMAYLPVLLSTVTSALGQAASTRLAKHFAAQERTAFRALLAKLVGISAGLSILSVLVSHLAGKTILSLLYRPEFAEHADLLPWILLSSGLWSIASMFGYAATAQQQFLGQPIVLGMTGLACWLLSAWLIPLYGLVGVIAVMIINAVIGMIGYGILMVRQ